MKRLLNLLLLFIVAMSIKAAEGIITLKTNQAVNSQFKLLAWTASVDDPVMIDWGDGVFKTYNIDPNAMTWAKWIKQDIKGQTITIKGNLKYFELTDAQLTSVDVQNMQTIEELYLGNNELTEVTSNGMPSLKNLDLSNNLISTFDTSNMGSLVSLKLACNKLTAFNSKGAPSIQTLDLSENNISDYNEFDIENLAETLRILNISKNNLPLLNLMKFTQLEDFNCSENPDLSTVVFNDGNPNLKYINMRNCYIMHFYGISLPSLYSLDLTNGALMEIEKGDYPKLEKLAIAGNYIEELDLSGYPELFELYCDSNRIANLDLGNCKKLNTLRCSKNNFKYLDFVNNKDIRRLDVSNNPQLTNIDITPLGIISELDISNTSISYIDLKSAYYLKTFKAANTQCQFFFFNYVGPKGMFEKVDIRNNKNMTANSVTFTLKTMPQREWKGSTPDILLEGSNAEHANTDYINSKEMRWTTDVQGDGTAKMEDVAVTLVGAKATGKKVSFTGSVGGIVNEQTFEFTEYALNNKGGKFTLSQWSGEFYQQLSDVTATAVSGVPVHVTPMPDAGYVFDYVLVNGKRVYDEWFVLNEASTIEVVYRTKERQISFTTTNGQSLSIALAGAHDVTPIQVDWGSGSKKEYEVYKGKWTRLDEVAIGDTIRVYGDVEAVNLESYGEFGEAYGGWNNKITSVDFSKNNILMYVNVYMNPIHSLDISGLANLQELDCSYCELDTISVKGLENLTYLAAYGNYLKSIDLSDNKELTVLNIKNNKLANLDLSANSKIVELIATVNELKDIDVKHLAGLTKLDVSFNHLTTIDLSNNVNLYELSVANNELTELNLDANTEIQTLSFAGNNIKWIDLHNLINLRKLYANDNAMTACELDDFYFNLPEYPELTEEELETVKGFSLVLTTGTDKKLNDAEHSDTYMAVKKGWSPNLTGDASGCDRAHIVIEPSLNGSIELTDAEGNVINSGDKVLKNSLITVTANPDPDYELESIKLNDIVITDNSFTISRFARVSALFRSISTSVDKAQVDGVRISTVANGIEISAADESQVEIYNTNGTMVYSGVVNGVETVQVASGLYIVKVANAEGTMARVMSVK